MSSSATDALPAWVRDPDVTLPLDALAPEDGELNRFCAISVVPRAGLRARYSVILPDGWVGHVGDSEGGPLSDSRYATLGLFSPGRGKEMLPMVAFGALLVSRGRTVKDYFNAFCAAEKYEIVTQRTAMLLAGEVVEGFVLNPSAPLGVLATRLVMFEANECLYALSGTTRLTDYPAVARVVGLALCSFELNWREPSRLALE